MWGRSYRFTVRLEHVRPVSHALTNQRVLNLANAHEVYRRLIGPNGADVSALTLRPIAYVEEGTDSEISLVDLGDGLGLRHCFPRTPLDTFGSRRAALLPRLRWEPVDGQHILYACTEIAAQEMAEGPIDRGPTSTSFYFLRLPRWWYMMMSDFMWKSQVV